MITERVPLSARVHGLKWNFGVQVRYSSSLPFIGKLGIKLLEVTNTKHGEPSSLHACSPGANSCHAAHALHHPAAAPDTFHLFLTVKHLQEPCHHTTKHIYVIMHCEGKHDSPVYTSADKEGQVNATSGSHTVLPVLPCTDHIAIMQQDTHMSRCAARGTAAYLCMQQQTRRARRTQQCLRGVPRSSSSCCTAMRT